jgi:hypothetical protein
MDSYRTKMNGGKYQMKRFLTLSLALVMAIGLAIVPAYACTNPTTTPAVNAVHGTVTGPCGGAFTWSTENSRTECDRCGHFPQDGASCTQLVPGPCPNASDLTAATCGACTLVTAYVGSSTSNCGTCAECAAGLAVPFITTVGVPAAAVGGVIPNLTTNPAGLTLDITNERLVPATGTAFEVKGWAINGRWSNKAITPKNITALMNRGGVFQLTDGMSAKAKDGPAKAVDAKGEEIKVADMTGADDAAKKVAWDAMVSTVAGANRNANKDTINGLAKDVLYTTGTGTSEKLFKVTDEFVPAARVVTFNPIAARDKAPRFVLNYTLYASASGRGAWTLSERGKTAEITATNIEFTKPADNKRFNGTGDTPDVWADFPIGTGIEVLDVGFGDRVGGKSTYLLRGKPGIKTANADPTKVVYVAGTRASKVGPSALGRAPNVKPNYKANNIKVRANLSIMGVQLDGTTGASTAFTTFAKTPNTNAANGPITVAIPAKDKLPQLVAGQPIVARIAATAKRPASATLTINPAAIGVLPEAGAITLGGKGKLTFAKTLEGAEKADAARWGRVPAVAVPTTKSSTIDSKSFFVRAKADAKAAKPARAEAGTSPNTADMVMTPTGALASAPVEFIVRWVIDAEGVATGTVMVKP